MPRAALLTVVSARFSKVALSLAVETDHAFVERSAGVERDRSFVLKREESAERRFSSAVKSLMLVRKLLPKGGDPDSARSALSGRSRPGLGLLGQPAGPVVPNPLTASDILS